MAITENPTESEEDLNELMKCYHSSIEPEVTKLFNQWRRSSIDDQEQGYEVLFDFLISLLTWQNSTLRSAANKLFKSLAWSITKPTI